MSKKQIEELKRGWQRTQADFENYKKRIEAEKKSWTDAARREFLSEILPILDNLHLTAVNVPEKLKSDNWVKGALIAITQIEQKLSELGIEKIAPAKGTAFDPNVHEAVRTENAKGIKPLHIIKVERPGWKIGEILIRPAQVVVTPEKPEKEA